MSFRCKIWITKYLWILCGDHNSVTRARIQPNHLLPRCYPTIESYMHQPPTVQICAQAEVNIFFGVARILPSLRSERSTDIRKKSAAHTIRNHRRTPAAAAQSTHAQWVGIQRRSEFGGQGGRLGETVAWEEAAAVTHWLLERKFFKFFTDLVAAYIYIRHQ